MNYVQNSDDYQTNHALNDLVGEYIARGKLIEGERKRLREIEIEIMRLMEETGAKELTIDGHTVKIETKIEYDKERLLPLLEYEEIPPSELERARLPEKVVPASWNMTKVKPLGKYSSRVRELIESCKVFSAPYIKITE